MTALPANSPAFEEAIKVTPLESHRYSAFLRDEWCIGTGMLYPDIPLCTSLFFLGCAMGKRKATE